MGSSRDLAVGTVAVASLLTASMLGSVVNANENPKLYLHLAFTATFFAGALQAGLGLLRLVPSITWETLEDNREHQFLKNTFTVIFSLIYLYVPTCAQEVFQSFMVPAFVLLLDECDLLFVMVQFYVEKSVNIG